MKILLIDDHELVRFGMKKLLEDLLESPSVLEADSLERGSALYAEQHGGIDLVVLDLNLPDARGLSGLRQFMQRHPSAPLVVLSGSVDDAIAAEATAIGAMAFLHKTSDVDGLRAKMSGLVARIRGFSPHAAGGLPRRPRIPDTRQMSLNTQDLQILDLVLQGHTNKEIAETMGLALGTTKNHISGLLAAFGVTSRARLIALFH